MNGRCGNSAFPHWTISHSLNGRICMWTCVSVIQPLGDLFFTALGWYEACVLTSHAREEEEEEEENMVPRITSISRTIKTLKPFYPRLLSHQLTLTKPGSFGDIYRITWAIIVTIFHWFCNNWVATCKIFLAMSQANDNVNKSRQSRWEHIFLYCNLFFYQTESQMDTVKRW